MANALATFGLKVTYLGALGYPRLHPVFDEFARRADVHSINEPGATDALEFEDGKLMLGKYAQFAEITWANLQQRFGGDRFLEHFSTAELVAFVNWTMLPNMSDIWEALLDELCPILAGPRRKIFFDLADPAKRTRADLVRATGLIARFSPYFDVILGLNEREAGAVGEALGLAISKPTPEGITTLALEIQRRLASTPWSCIRPFTPSPPAAGRPISSKDRASRPSSSPPARAIISTLASASPNCWDWATRTRCSQPAPPVVSTSAPVAVRPWPTSPA